MELESLMLNIDASLRVHARHQFFTWTQGLLQNLVKHELLICALRNGEPLLFHVDCFAVAPVEPVPFGESFRRDTSLVPHLIKTWEENYFRPARCEIGATPSSRNAAGARVGQNRYGFRACARNVRCVRQARKLLRVRLQTRTVTSKQAYFVEVVVPFLHFGVGAHSGQSPAGEAQGAPPGLPLC